MQTYAEKYMMRSRFFVLLGEAGMILADAFSQADIENQKAIKELAFTAMVDALVEYHGFKREELV